MGGAAKSERRRQSVKGAMVHMQKSPEVWRPGGAAERAAAEP
ncbi:hypothetical protein HM1_2735 [Heliomicrobium modesticaldum Ice1]|uniref:Uncharacterized protein n=1 Tax=Heliobacterium modesticaldum (strain ATCC 51547 / Ice1) TaxID=498761 RepID=B0TBZ1_HELMI|nr:hypothetical protein HM1_2735 [Heliomicrobium modesticaldum Ice1]